MSIVVVQRGHVPRTRGATGAPGEQEFARETAAALKPMLEKQGHTVRVIDADEPRNSYRGDLFVAIHYDSSSNSSATGASVGYQNGKGKRFAEAWKKHYKASGWDQGFREDNYSPNLGGYYGVRMAINEGNEMAIITESGFHTNKEDKALMSPERTATSIAMAVAEMTGKTPPEMEDDDMKLDDVIPLTKVENGKKVPTDAGKALNLPHITVGSALANAAAGGANDWKDLDKLREEFADFKRDTGKKMTDMVTKMDAMLDAIKELTS